MIITYILGYDIFSTCLHSENDVAQLLELSSHLDCPRMLGCALQEQKLVQIP